jgi:hypothetical protein
MTINHNLLDELLKGYQKLEDILGENGLLKQLTKAVLERALHAELTIAEVVRQIQNGGSRGNPMQNMIQACRAFLHRALRNETNRQMY